MEITFLGTGTSTGVPEIGCSCAVCRSTDSHDCRLRTSVLVEVRDVRFLLDCGPDFRQQMLPLPFRKIDAVLLSHEHYDHVGGLDDLRPFGRFGDVDVFAEKRVCDTILERMPYCFSVSKYPGSPNLLLHELSLTQSLMSSVCVQPIRVMHGKLPIFGFRIEQMAYLTDVSHLPESEFSKLESLDTLVVSALRKEPHNSHQTLSEALALIERIRPRQAYLIHMSHQFGLHAEMCRTLPDGIHVAYDGLSIRL